MSNDMYNTGVWTIGSTTGGIEITDDGVNFKPLGHATEFNFRVVDGVDYGKEEENMNNEVLELYRERKFRELKEKYNKMYKEEYDNLEEVKRYKELVTNFETGIAELVDEFNTEEYKPFIKTGYKSEYEYKISSELMDEIRLKHEAEYDKEYDELRDLVKEINAQLSISDDKDYQIDVLKRYGVLDKSGKLTA